MTEKIFFTGSVHVLADFFTFFIQCFTNSSQALLICVSLVYFVRL